MSRPQPNPPWLTAEQMRAWMAFLETSHLLQRRIDRQLRKAGGLTQPQYELLGRLAEAPDRRRRMSELAELLVTSASGVTYQVDQLVKAGLVTREACPDDDRGVVAAITEAGVQRLEQAAPGHVRVIREHLIDQIEPAELPAFIAVLERARDGLRGRSESTPIHADPRRSTLVHAGPRRSTPIPLSDQRGSVPWTGSARSPRGNRPDASAL